MFYFQQLLSQGLAGIDRTSVISTVTGIAYTVLLIGCLIGLYQAAMRGGDVQALGVTAIKYLIVAIILANWSTVFREVNDSFNQVATFIGNSSGAGDMFGSWLDQLKQQFETNGGFSFWDLITSSTSAVISAVLIVIAYLVYVVAVVVFGFFYTLFGCVLYTLGPLVLALLPMAGIGQLAKSFATNVMIWNSWGILYALFGALITAIHADKISSGGGFLGFFSGTGNSMILGLISIFYALALILIPFIAKRIISGDVGSTAQALVRAGATALTAAVSAGAGFAAGAGAGAGGSSAGAGAASGGSAASSAGPSGGVASSSGTTSSSQPPPVPSLAESIRSSVAGGTGASPSSAAPPSTESSSSGDGPSADGGQSSRGGGGTSRGGGDRGAMQLMPRGIAQFLAHRAGHAVGKAVSGSNES